ncbi:hypothetical protein B296_00026431 [Ensete ventricosum]|uniref:Uncharacterized protein n=1 Tax=Ensete ventricosum TaxID=4639 RepID=A0A426YT37_ENSVE|nr:hypothetical protein B296_00026431 [Ensete ventricosum]
MSSQLGTARWYTWMPGNSSLAPEGCASSSEYRLVDREPRWSPHARVNFWSFVELQSLRVCCDIPERVAYHRSEDVVWLASVGEASLFASALFRSSVGSPIVKASVGLWGHLDSAPPMIKLAMRSKGLECRLLGFECPRFLLFTWVPFMLHIGRRVRTRLVWMLVQSHMLSCSLGEERAIDLSTGVDLKASSGG